LSALRKSAERTLQAAQTNADLTRERRTGGVATALDVERAQADVERAKQNIADVELQIELANRSLRTLTSIEPSGESPVMREDDLHEEAPLTQWESIDSGIPAIDAATEQARSAYANAKAAKLSLIPLLTANFVERFTNATSFIGQPYYYTMMLNLVWRLDVPAIANIRIQSKLAEMADVRKERVRLLTHDQIHDAWQRVRTNIVKSHSARAQAKAAELAAQYANERYASGAGTQLDVIQARRDSFAAEVARIQADADLMLARALLRLNAGQSLEKDFVR
jgi:outer membrane protein TolC